MTPQRTGCCFCDIRLPSMCETPWNRVLYDSGNFIIVPTKGALVPGWLLVVAKRHVLCSGAVTSAEFAELRQCLATAQAMVRQGFGEPTIFEHGPSGPGTSLGCGVDHLHLHIVPLQFSLKRAATEMFNQVSWRSLSDLSCTSSLFDSEIDYGFVQEPGGEPFWCDPPQNTRQFFRRVVAAEMGISGQFDYAQFPHLSNVSRTLEKLSSRYERIQ